MTSSSQSVVISSAVSTMASSQPISLVGTMGLLQNSPQIQQNMSILQSQLTQQQIAALHQAQQQAGGVPSSNHQSVATLQNVQVLGSQGHQEGLGDVIIASGGQTYAVASNLQSIAQRQGLPVQMQIRPIPNAAAVVNQLQANQLTAQHIRHQQAQAAAAQQQAEQQAQQHAAVAQAQQQHQQLQRLQNSGNVPINIITTGSVGSNLQPNSMRPGVPTQMQIRSLAPNAAAVVNQIQANQITPLQIRNSVQQQQQAAAAVHQQQQQAAQQQAAQQQAAAVQQAQQAAAQHIQQQAQQQQQQLQQQQQQQQQQQLHQQQQQQQQQQQRLQNSMNTNANNPQNAGKQMPNPVNLSLPISQGITNTSSNSSASNNSPSQILTKRKLQDLLHEIDPTETMDDDVEEAVLQIADDFIENVINSSCQIAKHRESNTLEVKDVQLHLDSNWNMWIPGFGSDDLRPYKRLPSTEAHRQRLALIKKAMKK